MSAYKVGDTVFVVRYGYRAKDVPTTHAATVTKVGRKWITAKEDGHYSEDRFDAASGWVDGRGYNSMACLYPDEQTYRDERARDDAWDAFMAATRAVREVPVHLTTEQIVAMTASLDGAQ